MRKAINSLKVAKPNGAFSQVLKVGDFVYISGQLGIALDTAENTVVTGFENQVNQIFMNLNHLLSEMKMGINQVVRTVIYVVDGTDIANYSDIVDKYFKPPYPAASLVYVKTLPYGAKVEISFDAIDLSAYEAMQACDDDGCSGCDDCGIEELDA